MTDIDADMVIKAINASRRKNLSWGHRIILELLPKAAYLQVLREYEIMKAA